MANDFNLGRHEALIERLGSDVDQMKTDIGEIKDILAEKRGERRVAVWAAGVVGGAFGTFVSFITKLYFAKHS